ncbi:hypothetical protein [Nonomuraea diastatica]|uniref:Uncharacterized protein n=1 Tax=Nonomuraea diastatica TaxID=1848329 RepID=A0A4R4WYY8_9ACTN|nr:hypothetical protein [Nonomuraea diastatica]TDD23103.1 hypothetical protein E1294_09695 [Nonomuraea diastatica]
MRKLSAAGLALVSVALYGGLRVYWQPGSMPERLSPVGPDLVAFTGWGAVALCGAAAGTLVAMMTVRPAGPARTALAAVAWAVGGAFVVSGALLLLDAVGTIIPGSGIPVHPLGAASKAACVGCASRSARATCRRRSPGPPCPPTSRGEPGWPWRRRPTRGAHGFRTDLRRAGRYR